jgi:hypothetical protein
MISDQSTEQFETDGITEKPHEKIIMKNEKA